MPIERSLTSKSIIYISTDFLQNKVKNEEIIKLSLCFLMLLRELERYSFVTIINLES